MEKKIKYTCGHPGKLRPRSDNAFVETKDGTVIIEKACPVCRGKKTAEVKKSRIARWLERRKQKQDKAQAEAIARYEAAKKSGLVKPQVKPNRQQRRG